MTCEWPQGGQGVGCEDIPPPTTQEDCTTSVIYQYTIENKGEDAETIESFTGERDGGTFTILPPGSVVPPGDTITQPDLQVFNICEGKSFDTTIEATMVTADTEEEPCTDEATNSWTVVVPCEVEASITCMGGANGDTDCNQLSKDDGCEAQVNYMYIVENTGLTPMTIESFTVTVNGETSNLPGVNVEVDPGETYSSFAPVDLDLCQEAIITHSTEVSASSEGGGDDCEATAEYVLLLTSPTPTAPPTPPPTPPPTGACNVEVEVDCSSDFSETGECSTLIPIVTRCDKRASNLIMKFNGGDCQQSFNIQEAEKFICNDYNGGHQNPDPAYIVVHSRKSAAQKYFEGWVDSQAEFSLACIAPDCTEGKIQADSTVNVYSDESQSILLQLSHFHTSCSQNLFLKDRFGAVQLVQFTNEVQGTIDCFLNTTFGYTITNEGAAQNAEITDFFSIRDNASGGTDYIDLMDNLGDGTVEPGETVKAEEYVLIDMTVRLEYTTTTTIVGETPEGTTCSDVATLTFTAGNPLPPSVVPPTPSPTLAPTVSMSPTLDLETNACEVTAEVTCMGPSNTDCDNPLPDPVQCAGSPTTSISFSYVGGVCEDSSNDQNGKFECSDEDDQPNNVNIKVEPDKQADQEFEGVGKGDSITVNPGGEFKKIEIVIENAATGDVVQQMEIKTECKEDKLEESFSLGNTYGALQITAFASEEQTDVKYEATFTYVHKISNTGMNKAIFTTATTETDPPGDVTNLLDSIPGNTLEKGEHIELTTTQSVELDPPGTVDVTSYETTTTVNAQNSKGLACSAQDSIVVKPNLG